MEYNGNSSDRQEHLGPLNEAENFYPEIKDFPPIFDPTKSETFEVEIPFQDIDGTNQVKKVEAIHAAQLPDLETLDDSYTEKGNQTCWGHGNFDRLHVFSKNMQKRATVHIEYTYVINMGDSEKRFKSYKNLMKYLEYHGL